MSIVIVASHSEMANGIKQTVEYIMGEQTNLYAIPAYTQGFENVEESVEKIMKEHPNEQAYVLTDLLGGSVNSEIKNIMGRYPKLHLITGVNLSLVIQILLVNDTTMENEIIEIIEQAKNGVVYMNIYENRNETFDDF